MVIVVMPNVVALDLAVPMQVFGSWPPHVTGSGVSNPYDTVLCGPQPVATVGPRLSAGDLRPLSAMRGADTIVVPGCLDPLADVPTAVLRELASAAERGTRVRSICSGAFVLAEAGLLDGRPATTHWRWARDLQRRHPLVDVQEQHLYVDDGQVLTSAGVLAGTDLCLHVVRRDAGQAIANELARFLVSPPHREGGQAQYVSRPVPAPFRVARRAAFRAVAGPGAAALAHLHRPAGLRERPRANPPVPAGDRPDGREVAHRSVGERCARPARDLQRAGHRDRCTPGVPIGRVVPRPLPAVAGHQPARLPARVQDRPVLTGTAAPYIARP